MCILPAPDIISGIFILCRGIFPGDISLQVWASVREGPGQHDIFAEDAGIDAAVRTSDRALLE
jgi:hypothetical protein